MIWLLFLLLTVCRILIKKITTRGSLSHPFFLGILHANRLRCECWDTLGMNVLNVHSKKSRRGNRDRKESLKDLRKNLIEGKILSILRKIRRSSLHSPLKPDLAEGFSVNEVDVL